MLHDPSYVPAYSYASLWHQLRIPRGWSPDPGADSDDVLALATAAIERDANDATALANIRALAIVFAPRLRLRDRLLGPRARPNCAIAWGASSLTCGYLGDFAKAIERAAYAVRLSPLSPELFLFEHFLSQSHYLAGHFEEAVVWGRRSLGRNLSIANLRALIASLVAGGHTEDARVLATRLMTH